LQLFVDEHRQELLQASRTPYLLANEL
jgi:hypothetical protein